MRLGHVPALDGLRGIAIALVLALHSGYGEHILGGGLGVDVFFVLSGFLITTLLLQEHSKTGGLDLKSFYIRRALRLYPALIITVVVASVGYALMPSLDLHIESAPIALLYLTNLGVAFTGAEMDALNHTWTLALEEQFYLVWPAMLLVTLARGSRRAAAAVAGSGVVVSWLSLWFWTGHAIDGIPQAYYRPDSRAAALLLGCLVALALTNERGRRICSRPTIGAAGALLLVLTVILMGRGPADYLRHGIPLASLATCAIIASLATHRDSTLSTVLSWGPLRQLGVISYGVYLYSGPLNSLTEAYTDDWATPAVAMFRTGGAIAAAAILYVLVEQPVRTAGRDRLGRSGERVA